MRILQAHQGLVLGLAFSPDGQRLVSTDTQGTICLWDCTYREPQILSLPSPVTHVPVYGAAFSPDNRYLAVGIAARHTNDYPKEGIGIWDISTMQVRYVATGGISAYQLVYHPDGRSLIASCFQDGSRLVRRDLVEHRVWPFAQPRNDIWQVAISHDGRWLGGAGNHSIIHVWSLPSGEIFSEGDCINGTISSLAFDPSGNRLVAVGTAKGWMWTHPHSWSAIIALNQYSERAAIFTPDGRKLLSAGDNPGVRQWNPDTWELEAEYRWSVGRVDRLAVSPDGSRAALGGDQGKVIVWDLE